MSSKPVSHRATATKLATATRKTSTLDRLSGGTKLAPELWLPRSQTYAGIAVELRPDPTALRAQATFAAWYRFTEVTF